METQQKWWNFPICPLLVTLPHAEATSQLNIHTGYISIHYVCYIMTELELYGWPCSIRRHQERFWTRVPIEKGEAKKVIRLLYIPSAAVTEWRKENKNIERNTKIKKRQGEKWHAHSNSSTIWTWLWPIQQQLDTPGPRKPFSIRWQQVPRFLSCTRLIYKHTPFPTATGESETRRIVITSLAPCVLLLCYFIFIFLVCIQGEKKKKV